MSKFLITIIVLVGCGQIEKYEKGNGGYNTDNRQDDINHDPSPAATAVSATSEYASYAATAADVPQCQSATQNELVYVEDVQIFEACESGSWVNIKIQGKDGKDAPDPINEKYLWKDPVTAVLWMLPGAAMPYSQNVTCSGVYREPTPAEAALAAQRGLKLAANTLSAPMIIWTNQVDNTIGEYIYDMGHSPMQQSSQLKTALGGAYCIHN